MTPPLHREDGSPADPLHPGPAPQATTPPGGTHPPTGFPPPFSAPGPSPAGGPPHEPPHGPLYGPFATEPDVGGSGGTGETVPTAAAGHAGTDAATAVPAPGMSAGTGERPVAFVDGRATLALVRTGTEEAAGGTPGPELTPDAILPPGTRPETPPEPPPDPHATATGPVPRLGAGPGFPGGPHDRRPGNGFAGSSRTRRALLVGGGLLAALLLGGGGALAVTQLSGRPAKDQQVAQSPPPAPTPVTPTPTPSPSRAKVRHKHVPVDIRDEKTDPRPLTIGEVFPHRTIKLAGHTFVLAKTVINDHCSLAAGGAFATELTSQHCRRVVRATFVSTDKKLAVTTGIAVMPTDAAARAVLKAQDPAHHAWFRGMKATGAPKIEQAPGYAASTMRGRYISYAYATYADAHQPAKGDTTLKTVGTAFRDMTVRPIARRAKQH